MAETLKTPFPEAKSEPCHAKHFLSDAKARTRKPPRSPPNVKTFFPDTTSTLSRTPRSTIGSEDTETPMRQVLHPERHDRQHDPKTTDASRSTPLPRTNPSDPEP